MEARETHSERGRETRKERQLVRKRHTGYERKGNRARNRSRHTKNNTMT